MNDITRYNIASRAPPHVFYHSFNEHFIICQVMAQSTTAFAGYSSKSNQRSRCTPLAYIRISIEGWSLSPEHLSLFPPKSSPLHSPQSIKSITHVSCMAYDIVLESTTYILSCLLETKVVERFFPQFFPHIFFGVLLNHPVTLSQLTH